MMMETTVFCRCACGTIFTFCNQLPPPKTGYLSLPFIANVLMERGSDAILITCAPCGSLIGEIKDATIYADLSRLRITKVTTRRKNGKPNMTNPLQRLPEPQPEAYRIPNHRHFAQEGAGPREKSPQLRLLLLAAQEQGRPMTSPLATRTPDGHKDAQWPQGRPMASSPVGHMLS